MELTPDTKNKYLKALNELCATLSVSTSMPVDTAEFCTRHRLKASLFDALRDLDGLVYDFAKSDINTPWYKATPELHRLSPEQVVSQMRASGRPKQAEPSPDALQAFGNAFEAAAIPAGPKPMREWINEQVKNAVVPGVGIEADVIFNQLKHNRASIDTGDIPTDLDPQPLEHPYTIKIQASWLRLKMHVQTSEDADLVDTILSKLNRAVALHP